MSVIEIHEKIYNSVRDFWLIFLGKPDVNDSLTLLLYNGFIYGTLIFLGLMIVIVPWKLLKCIFGGTF